MITANRGPGVYDAHPEKHAVCIWPLIELRTSRAARRTSYAHLRKEYVHAGRVAKAKVFDCRRREGLASLACIFLNMHRMRLSSHACMRRFAHISTIQAYMAHCPCMHSHRMHCDLQVRCTHSHILHCSAIRAGRHSI